MRENGWPPLRSRPGLAVRGCSRPSAGRASCTKREVGRMAARKVAHPSVDDRRAKGLEARDRAPLSSHTKWRPAKDRPDPVDSLVAQETTREPDLIPVRHGRMMV